MTSQAPAPSCLGQETTEIRASKRRRLDQPSAVVGIEHQRPGYSESPGISDIETLYNTGCISSANLVESSNCNLVCFGMVPKIYAKCHQAQLPSKDFAVQIVSSQQFAACDLDIHGTILSDHGQMLQGLLDDETIVIHACCTIARDSTAQEHCFRQTLCVLELTIYGPFDLLDEIGDFFQAYDVYLQDPRDCHRDVKYCNPHRLFSSDWHSCLLLSDFLSTTTLGLAHLEDVTERVDLLDIISSQDHLEEADQPRLIAAALHRHQRQALTFMLRRERGWDLNNSGQDVWEAFDSGQTRYFINRVSNVHQADPPAQFVGGIIADPMGLGKTLNMIALISTDYEDYNQGGAHWGNYDSKTSPVAATLIIVPQPLLATWEYQLSEHVKPGYMNIFRHHGKTRLARIDDLNNITIVLTTYQTLSADWKAGGSDRINFMFSVSWRRIILDEAHVIRNMKSRMARAICDLSAISRWAVTGTPIQNNLNDLAALLKFIRACPYDDPKRFESDISRLWKSDGDVEAVQRLKRLSKCLILRRDKRTIKLPERHDFRCPVDFSDAERKLYDSVHQKVVTKLDDVLHEGSTLSTTGIYVNMLQQIESLRLICNLGVHYHSRHETAIVQASSEWAMEAQKAFNIQREMEVIFCSQCSSILDLTDTIEDTDQDTPQFSQCLKFACAECSHRLRLAKKTMVCGHPSRCPSAPVSIANVAFEETGFQLSGPARDLTNDMPSKVKALVADLKSLASNVKSIVFSTWRLTLDVVKAGLMDAGIQSVRFDGKVPQKQRSEVLNQFKTDPNCRVLLLTLSCGAVGLTLTEASRAYLMEPHWNPTIEEQALARIHRIGQTREVTTVRFYIRDSFEETVMEVQKEKKNLAGLLKFDNDDGSVDDSLGALRKLRRLL
ncbi:SNF2 family N-terminal domain-containing protein [Lophiotrema nucula]|uniref:SNF2 family N-terminal domain-containing protein n=1 Tax=Lophiotrema nucula TaxID=690887 RepID=A0A6A5YNA4_9PLEO|nr:SNF2 family N-terminal domain-containing protein [Lophiotrema nucula]